jgi:hypothetical protein
MMVFSHSDYGGYKVDLNLMSVAESLVGYIAHDHLPEQVRGRLNLAKLLPLHTYCDGIGSRQDDYICLLMDREELDLVMWLLLLHTVPDPYNGRPTK